jgi:hypothetical protein
VTRITDRWIEEIIVEHEQEAAKDICNTILDHAVQRDDRLRQTGKSDEIDDKTVFIIKRA